MLEQSDTFITLSGPSTGIYKEKKSKFLAFAYPVSTDEEIKKHLNDLKKDFFDARHHCFAYVLGINRDIYRASDDNEPSGTAGKPILGQINSFKLTNILIVVVRYFGGTLLGTGGLVKAYSNAAADALHNSILVERTLNTTFNLSFDYEVMNNIMHIIKEENLEQLNQNFDLKCNIVLSVRNSRVKIIQEKFLNIKTVKLSFEK
jgi:uncharacterized protein, YigZ family